MNNRMYLFLLSIIAYTGVIHSSAVTYGFSKGRFADQVASYCHARWISYSQNIEFLYRPFIYSEQLYMHYAHAWYSHKKKSYAKTKKFPEKGGVLDIVSLTKNRHENVLYLCHFFPEIKIDALTFDFAHFEVNWKDQRFRELLRKEIRPLKELPAPTIPKGYIGVAVHVRRGSGPDKNFFQVRSPREIYVDKKYPLRFPPDTYYLEQIKRLAELFSPTPLYIHLFTDDKNPAALAEKYKLLITNKNIIVGYRTENKLGHNYDLEDFFGITHFECIIRPESHFSLIASKIGKARLVVHPVDYQWNDRELIVTEVETLEQNP